MGHSRHALCVSSPYKASTNLPLPERLQKLAGPLAQPGIALLVIRLPGCTPSFLAVQAAPSFPMNRHLSP